MRNTRKEKEETGSKFGRNWEVGWQKNGGKKIKRRAQGSGKRRTEFLTTDKTRWTRMGFSYRRDEGPVE